MLPPLPEVPDDQRATGAYPVRFEDITQDGRLMFAPLVASVDAAVWAPLLMRHPLSAKFESSGIRAIFTRIVLEATPARIRLGMKLEANGTYQLAHDRADDGTVSRLYLNMWTEIWAAHPKRDEKQLMGRLFAEHVLTRPLGPPEQRRVTEVPGLELPPARYRQPQLDALLEPPSHDDEWLEPAPREDATSTVFGITHTDSNGHVNSLVYPRLFEEAALRRLAALGKPTKVLARRLEIAFRKPFFAGQSAGVALRAFARRGVSGAAGASSTHEADALGATGVFLSASDLAAPAQAKPHAYVRMGFER